MQCFFFWQRIQHSTIKHYIVIIMLSINDPKHTCQLLSFSKTFLFARGIKEHGLFNLLFGGRGQTSREFSAVYFCRVCSLSVARCRFPNPSHLLFKLHVPFQESPSLFIILNCATSRLQFILFHSIHFQT